MFDHVLDILIDRMTPVPDDHNALIRYGPEAIKREALEDYARTINHVQALVGGDPDPETAEGALALMVLAEAHKVYALNEASSSRFIDPVAGVLSREALVKELFTAADAMARGERDQVGLYAIDLNNLKAVNDTLSHAEGDRYIRIAGSALALFAPYGFAPGRVSGDELLVIAPDHQADPEADLDRIKLTLASSISSFVRELGARSDEARALFDSYPLGAAVGYAPLLPAQVGSLGERPSITDILHVSGADRAMYDEKQTMKRGRSYR
jgi:diguanylate cyclase (GGDEF)-like protein